MNRIVWNPPWNPPDEAWAANEEPAAPGASDNPMKVVKIYFKEPDYYIHGTGSLSSLGGAVSHGCLRMAPSDAAVSPNISWNTAEPRATQAGSSM